MLNTDTEGVASVISHDRITISCSDAGAHNIFLCDADFGLQVLGTWVRDRGLFSMEKAGHEVTGKVAAIYGLQERGTLEVTSPRPFGAFCLCLGPDPSFLGPARRDYLNFSRGIIGQQSWIRSKTS